MPIYGAATAERTYSISGLSCTYRPEVVERVYNSMVIGKKSFWTEVHQPYMQRNLTNREVRALIGRGLEQSRGWYIQVVTYFNMPRGDYRRFLNFLWKHNLELNCMEFRQVPRGVDTSITLQQRLSES